MATTAGVSSWQGSWPVRVCDLVLSSCSGAACECAPPLLLCVHDVCVASLVCSAWRRCCRCGLDRESRRALRSSPHGSPLECAAGRGSASLLEFWCAEQRWDPRCFPRVVELACRADGVECLRVLVRRGMSFDEMSCARAAESGALECLKFLRESAGCPWDHRTCSAATVGGSQPCLRYAMRSGCPFHQAACCADLERSVSLVLLRLRDRSGDIEEGEWAGLQKTLWGVRMCMSDAGVAFEHCPFFLAFREAVTREDRDKLPGPSWYLPDWVSESELFVSLPPSCRAQTRRDSEFWQALFSGNLRWLHQALRRSDPQFRSWGYPNEVLPCCNLSSIAAAAAVGCPLQILLEGVALVGLLDGLVLLHERYGAKLTVAHMSAAAESGSLECLDYCYNKCDTWNAHVTFRAAEAGRLECLRFLRERGCQWTVSACSAAARNGHLDCLQYCHENRCPCDKNVSKSAASGGHLECLQYCHRSGMPWDAETCLAAINGNSLACLKYAHENGCPWTSEVTEGAALKAEPALLRYALLNGCPVSSLAYANAARGGCMLCLRLLENSEGCHFTLDRMCLQAACGGSLVCLVHCHELGMPWDWRILQQALEGRMLAIFQYARQNGCPRNRELEQNNTYKEWITEGLIQPEQY